MEIRDNSPLALTMKWALTHYTNEAGWIIDGRYASEKEVVELISMAFKQFSSATVKKAIEYLRENWGEHITKETRHSMNKKIMAFETALSNNEDVSAFIADEERANAALYCLLGELYDNKSDVLLANYWYQKSAMLGYPEGEGKLGQSYHRGYGMTADDFYGNDCNMEMIMHMRSDEQALFWLQKALDDGWTDAVKCIEQVKEDVAELEKMKNLSLDEMIKEANQGWGPQQMDLADAYENGDESKGIPVDYEKAVYWYKKSLYGIVIEYDICQLIAEILENKIGDKKRALRYYRKAYLVDNVTVLDDGRQKLESKIKAMTKELFPDREENVAALSDMLNADQLSDKSIKDLAEIMEYIQESIYEERTVEDEQAKLLRRIPKAKAIVNAAFNGRAVAENALGIFYENGVILPMNFDNAMYWYLCAYTDGYDNAYINLAELLLNRGKKEEWKNFIILAASDGIEDAKKKCNDIGIDCKKFGPLETRMLDLYSMENLFYQDATEEQIELVELFFKLNDMNRRRNILFRLVPAAHDKYVDAFINGKPYSSNAIIDKLMDTADWQERKNVIAEAGIEVRDEILKSIPYMPLNEEEQRCVFLHGFVTHRRSPYRMHSFSQKWDDLTEKEKTIVKIMDADHRLTFDVANLIVNNYEKKIIENEKEKQTLSSEKSALDDEHIFWRDFGSDSCYMKRKAYADLKITDTKITDEALRQAGVNRFLNHINLEVNPILQPLVSWAATFHYDRLEDQKTALFG
ncbi:MAG: hypothetical protein K6G45_02060 [Lachnospiraceae bacterium]|nr:hypothetical protein [Lachnospiraceae bacterium]